MKTIFAMLVLVFCMRADAQFVFVLTHGAANTPEFKKGCPTNWPYLTIKSETPTLPSTNALPEQGDWKVLSIAEHTNILGSLSAEKEAWNKERARLEAEHEWSALEFYNHVETNAPGAWDRMDAAAANAQLPDDVRALVRKAIRQSQLAVTVRNNNADTMAFMQLAVAIGVLTQEQADRILHP